MERPLTARPAGMPVATRTIPSSAESAPERALEVHRAMRLQRPTGQAPG